MKQSNNRTRNYRVRVNGTYLDFPQGAGIDLVDETVYLPFQTLFEALGFQVDCDAASATVTAQMGGTMVQMTAGEATAAVTRDGETNVVDLPLPSRVKDGIVYVNARFAADVLGYNVMLMWDISGGFGNEVRVVDIINPLPQGTMYFPQDLLFLLFREPSIPRYTSHGISALDAARVSTGLAVLKKLNVLDETYDAAAVLTCGKAVEAIGRLMNGGADQIENYMDFCVQKGILDGDADADAVVTIGAFVEMMDKAMGYVTAGTEHSYADYVYLAWNGGLLEGASAYGPPEYALPADFAALVLYNALTARYCPNLIGENSRGFTLPIDYTSRSFAPTLGHMVFHCDAQGEPLTLEQHWLDNVPYLACYRDDGKAKPVVIYEHGWGDYIGKNSSAAGILHRLAEAGFYAVAVELWGHGERINDQPLYHPMVTAATVEDIDRVLDYLGEHVPQADISRLGVTGFSLGGQTTWQYGALGRHKVSALVPMHCPNDIENYYAYPDGVSVYYDPNGTWTWSVGSGAVYQYLTEDYILDVNKRTNPLHHVDRFLDTAILMQHGGSDSNMNDECFKPMLEMIRNAGGKYCELSVAPGVDHCQTEEEIGKMIRFFVKWLQ